VSPGALLRVDPLEPDPRAVARIVRALDEGGVVALPSDTLYGLSADASSGAAVERITRLKRYRSARPFVLLFDGSTRWLDRLAQGGDPVVSALASRVWPGAVTLIVRASPSAPPHVVSPEGGIALRAPDHALSQSVVAGLGRPIVSTSANVAGQAPCADPEAIRSAFGDELALIVDGGAPQAASASTIIDVTGDRPRLVRKGTRLIDLDSIVRDD
jgi:tRNA threonylcarbamoyl adenosine modification protein (Sua5/YciO/YrdC/YwlC family)